MSQRFDLYCAVKHPITLDAARAMIDRPSAQAAGLPFDEAYSAIARFNFAYEDNPLLGELIPGFDEPAANMDPTSLFGVASSIDTLLSHGSPDQAKKAAAFTVELARTLNATAQPDARQDILANVLGIELPSETPVAQQLVERRLLPDADIEAQMALSALINLSAR